MRNAYRVISSRQPELLDQIKQNGNRSSTEGDFSFLFDLKGMGDSGPVDISYLGS